MIVTMKRAFVLINDEERRETLRDLRKLGVMHLEPMTGTGTVYDDLVKAKSSINSALDLLAEYKTKKASMVMGSAEGLEKAKLLNSYAEKLKAANDEAIAIAKEIERVSIWGNFDPNLLHELKENGISIRLVMAPAKKYKDIFADIDYFELGIKKGYMQLALISADDFVLPSECLDFPLPLKSMSELENDLKAAKANALSFQEKIKDMAPLKNGLKQALAKTERRLTFETANSGMQADDGIAWFSGWIPASEQEALSTLAAKSGWALILDDPLDEELPPTKIKNNALVSIIQPVLDFLGTVPNYREYDISALFILFFAIFVAMIFGDGGYGGVLLVTGIILGIKSKLAKKPLPDTIKLLLVLASASFIWGVLTVSWFGIPHEHVPSFLKSFSIYWLSNENPDSGDNIKQFCFILGLIQLSIAHLKNIKRDFPSLQILGQLGQILMLAGMYFLALNLVISSEKHPMPMWAVYLVASGFGLSFVFSNYVSDKNFFIALAKSILCSFVNFVSVFLGVVNVFADIVSYIRLWAVGLAGLAISQTVNGMAGPLLGKAILFAIGVFLLVFGHGFNIIMSVLSVVVHGVRLNILEFSGHLGMEWSGYSYEPFRETIYLERANIERSI